MRNRITIYDLANQLNVSPGTVSRSLNNHPSISQKTKERVLLKAKELGYKVNKFAVNLRTQKSNTIGVIIPKLNSYFMSTLLSGVEKVANEAGYNLIISQSLESMEKEKMNAKTLFNSGVDALLVSLAYNTEEYDHFTPYMKSNIPLIFMDRVHDLPNCSTIVIDNVQAGYDATNHLIEQGCKNMLIITGNLKRNVYVNRFLGYKKALEQNNIAFKKVNVFETAMEAEKAFEVIDYIKKMKEPVDGLFFSSDSFAAHCIKKLKDEGFRIPQGIKVIGFNNDPISKLISPSLSTIDYPGYDMGLLAGESIINQLKGTINLQNANSISLRHQLIVRESSVD